MAPHQFVIHGLVDILSVDNIPGLARRPGTASPFLQGWQLSCAVPAAGVSWDTTAEGFSQSSARLMIKYPPTNKPAENALTNRISNRIVLPKMNSPLLISSPMNPFYSI
jgi:hypothetical protein